MKYVEGLKAAFYVGSLEATAALLSLTCPLLNPAVATCCCFVASLLNLTDR